MSRDPRGYSHAQRVPPRVLPWAYLGPAQLALGLALATVVAEPQTLGDFYYHGRAIALVHLVTLGWISGSILGALYMVGPVALRTPLPASRIDGIACGLYWFGMAGLASHFWIDEYSGMVGAAATVLLALCVVAARVAVPIARAPVPWPIRLHLGLAFANILIAGTVGTLVGIEKLGGPTFPGAPLDAVLAHAHVAALGWATMMVIGVGYRLLPMLLPAAPPSTPRMAASAIFLQAGVLGLLVALPVRSSWSWVAAGAVILGLATFAVNVGSMLRNPRPAPGGLRRPDLPMGNTLQALGYLGLSMVLGLVLLAMAPSQLEIRLAWLYGTLGLMGFLAQIVVGVGGRLFPLVAWMQAFVDADFEAPATSQYRMQHRGAQAAVLVLWTAAIPLLAAGLYTAGYTLVRIACAALLVALLIDGVNRALVVDAARSGAAEAELT